MCEKCIEIDKKIDRYRAIQRAIADQVGADNAQLLQERAICCRFQGRQDRGTAFHSSLGRDKIEDKGGCNTERNGKKS